MTDDGKKMERSLSEIPSEGRRCKNWLESYMKWVKHRTDAPVSYVTWTALFTLSTIAERKVEIDFGAWVLCPNLFVMLVGPPGMRKTATMENFSSRLLDQIPDSTRGPDMFTKEQLFNQTMMAPRNAVHLMVGEFGDLLQKNGPEFFDTLITYYDAKNKLVEGTRLRGNETIIKPCLNMLAGTTPAWISDNMRAAVIGGGFASRCIWVFENELREPNLFQDDETVNEEANLLEADLLHDLTHISKLSGQFLVPGGETYNAKHERLKEFGDRNDKKVINDWYKGMARQKDDNQQIALYLARKHVQILKLAMLHSLAVRDDMIVFWEDVQFGITAVESTEKKLLRVFGGMGRNPYSEDLNKICDWVIEQTGLGQFVEAAELLRKYQNSATPRMLTEIVQGLVTSKQLQVREKNGKEYIFPGEFYINKQQPLDNRMVQ